MTTAAQNLMKRSARLVAKALVPRMDANETAAFARELEYVLAQTYDKKYPDLKARLFIPVNSEIPAYAESFVWYSYDQVGAAKIIANYADDLPASDVVAKQVSQIIRDLGTSYGFSIGDLRAISAGIKAIDKMRGMSARRAIDLAIDHIAAFGASGYGLPGFLNHENVPLIGKPDITGDWLDPDTPAAKILEDLYKIEAEIPRITNTVESPNTLLLPTAHFRAVSQRPISAERPEETPLSVFMKNAVNVRNVDQWFLLDNANATNDGPRAVIYDRSPDKLDLVIPEEFTQQPAQARGLSFQIPCTARIGGVSVKYPMSMLYVDGI